MHDTKRGAMSELPSPELMFDFSKRTLQDLVITSLDRSARHRKAAKAALDEAVREEATGLLASYFLEHREAIRELFRADVEMKEAVEFPKQRTA